ncbi:MAG: sodium/solute symporter [Planctomycetaceae bacterium]|nr:sodium/solute symporter [Planctomycetaceae bacterium]
MTSMFGAVNPMVIDTVIFFGFLFMVVFIGITMSRKDRGSGESYFLAGRGLGWWLIGISLIAANISTEQFVGMSGQGADKIGLAIASYEWIGAVTLVFVAFLFLPRFLKSGIYTIPEFLEHRYNKSARTLMSLSMIFILVFVTSAAVVYSGAKPYLVFFKDINIVLESGGQSLFAGNPLTITSLSWIIGIIAASYVFMGGLKACAWADLLQGSALILCGAVILYFALGALSNATPEDMTTAMQVMEIDREKITETVPKLAEASSIERFQKLNEHKLRMNMPWTDGTLPIIALFFGIWIPNFYYWGLNQYIMQRTLGAQSLSQGQKGIVFAAFLKLLIPFIVIFPGIIAFNLYHADMKEARQKELFGRDFVDAMQAGTSDIDQLTALKEAGLQASMQKNTDNNLLFHFDDKFAVFEPAAAVELIRFDAKVLEIPTPEMNANDPESLMAAMKVIKKANDDRGFMKQLDFSDLQTGYDFDAAFPLLVTKLVPAGGMQGFVLAALLGAIISSLAAMLNAASTIFTIDIYKEYIHKGASEWMQVTFGRFCVIVFMVVACIIAPKLADPKFNGIFTFIQEFQGYISPGILAAFLFGFAIKRPCKWSGATALALNPIVYGLLMFLAPNIPTHYEIVTIILTPFLNRMAVSFLIVLMVMTVMTMLWPNKDERKTEVTSKLDMRPSYVALVLGVIAVLITIALYVHFWDTTTPMFPLK